MAAARTSVERVTRGARSAGVRALARRWLFAAGVLGAVAGCRPSECAPPTLCQITKSYHFAITPSVAPPYAREAILYKIVVRDRDSREPIETGEGQIYASNIDRANTWDGFAKGAELGTYYGKLNYVTSGTWAVAIRFRRDSLSPLETTEWMQDVLNEREDTIP